MDARDAANGTNQPAARPTAFFDCCANSKVRCPAPVVPRQQRAAPRRSRTRSRPARTSPHTAPPLPPAHVHLPRALDPGAYLHPLLAGKTFFLACGWSYPSLVLAQALRAPSPSRASAGLTESAHATHLYRRHSSGHCGAEPELVHACLASYASTPEPGANLQLKMYCPAEEGMQARGACCPGVGASRYGVRRI
jgi:hypothetical protein